MHIITSDLTLLRTSQLERISSGSGWEAVVLRKMRSLTLFLYVFEFFIFFYKYVHLHEYFFSISFLYFLVTKHTLIFLFVTMNSTPF